MAKKTTKKAKIKKADVAVAKTAAPAPGDFNLNPEYYEQTDVFEVYSTENKITKIFGLRGKGANTDQYIKARTRSKRPIGWRFSYGIDLHGPGHVARFVQGLMSLARKIGWRVQPGQDIENIKSQLRDSEETLVRLENTNRDLREKHEELMVAFRVKQEQILKSRVEQFQADVEQFEQLIASVKDAKISEQDLQEFLFAHPWLFGTEYVNAEPQKLRGAHSRFDFYLERFNKTNDIVEIKLLSDSIINADGGLTAKVSQAVDQLIDYMESSQAAAHSSVISEEEGIRELRPRGIVIIGSDDSQPAKNKLHKWNYQFGHITILTYNDVLDRAKSVLQHLRG